MRIIKSYVLIAICIVFISCQKQAAPVPISNTTNNTSNTRVCGFTVAGNPSDTNYIPHKLNNYWTYCEGNYDWGSTIIKDSSYSKGSTFVIKYFANNPYGNFQEKTRIDSNGVYYSIMMYAGYGNGIDTVMIINPHANNGDTIYKNLVKDVYTILVDKNATCVINSSTQIAHCYYVKIVCPAKNTVKNNYYKKGIGLLTLYDFKLSTASIQY